MSRRAAISLVLICFLGANGCHWVGSTAGKAQAKIERKIDAVQDGYEKGYTREKTKTNQ